MKEFEWSREAISSAYGAMTLASAFAAPVMGQLVDQWGPRWIVGPSLMLGAAAFGSLSVLTPHLWHLYLVYLVLGVAVSGTSPVVYSRVISSWFDRRRGTALAVMVASAGVGAIVHPPPSNA